MKEKIVLIGGGGHCKSCIDVIEQEGRFEIAGIVDVKEKIGRKVLGYEIFATDDDLPNLANEYQNYLITTGQIRTPDFRIRLFNKLKELNFKLQTIISPLAYVSKHSIIGEGTIISHQAIVNAGSEIGDNCIINSKALVEHDVIIEDHVHIAPRATISGGCIVRTGSFIGTGTVIIPGIEVGPYSFIKASKLIK